MTPIDRYALISVSDKTGVVTFAKGLAAFGIKILSTGGTAKALRDAGLDIIDVGDYTRFPEMMDGRLKTLHPLVHGGILGRDVDKAVMDQYKMVSIDFVVVNLYPFKATVAKPGCTFEDAIENIDIGGPTMLRAAAKNHTRVGVICDPADYAGVLEELKKNEGVLNPVHRRVLAQKVFECTNTYDYDIARYLFTHWPKT